MTASLEPKFEEGACFSEDSVNHLLVFSQSIFFAQFSPLLFVGAADAMAKLGPEDTLEFIAHQ